MATNKAAPSAKAGNAGTAIPLAQAMAALPRDFESEKTRLGELVRLLAGPLCDSPGLASVCRTSTFEDSIAHIHLSATTL